MKDFDSVWKDLISNLKGKKSQETLVRKYRHRILSSTDKGIEYFSLDGKRTMVIKKEHIGLFWDVLSKEGKLTIKLLEKHGVYDMRRKSQIRMLGGMIASFLTRLNYVDYKSEYVPESKRKVRTLILNN